MQKNTDVPVDTRTLILSKLYYGVFSGGLEEPENYFSKFFFFKQNTGCSQQFICNPLTIVPQKITEFFRGLNESTKETKHRN